MLDSGPTSARVTLPALLGAVALLLLAAAVVRDVAARHDALERARAAQDAPLADLRRVKIQLDQVGRDTAALAAAGNPRAAAVIAELRRRGIAIDPNAPRVQP